MCQVYILNTVPDPLVNACGAVLVEILLTEMCVISNEYMIRLRKMKFLSRKSI